MNDVLRRLKPSASRLVVLLAVLYLVLAWASVYAVDALNVAGTRDALLDMDLHMPHLWVHLFGEGHLTEWLQWGLLGAIAVCAAFLAGSLYVKDLTGAASFWGLFATLAALMLIEDAGNPRHQLARYTAQLLPGERLGTLVGEIVVFALLGSLALYALIRFGRWPLAHKSTSRYLLGGAGFYGLAVGMSATRDMGGDEGWYGTAGRALADGLFGGRLVEMTPGWVGLDDPLGYHLMDYLVEESLELLGASLLFAATLSYATQHAGRREPSPPTPGARAAEPDTPPRRPPR